MVLDIYYKRDIESGIKMAVVLAVKVHVANGSGNVEHIRGILDGAHAQATLYSLSWPGIVDQVRGELGADVCGLLDAATWGYGVLEPN